MARKRKQVAAPKTFSPKAMGMGYASNLDTSTLPLPEHPSARFASQPLQDIKPRQ